MRTFVGILVAAAALAQQPNGGGAAPQQKCMLDGTATDSLTGEALRKVMVRLTPANGGVEYVVMTDAAGRFHFEGFRAGDYELTGERAGYLRSSFGARRPENRGTILHFSTGETLSDLELKLTRHSSISGKILDDDGEPVAGASIVAFRQTWIRGQREYGLAAQASLDDAGEYRIGDLAPGAYYLQASVPPERFIADPGKPEQEIASAYFPDAPTIETATAFEIEPAQNLTGLNFHLHTREVFHIRGQVKGTDLPRSFSIIATAAAEGNLQSWRFEPGNRAAVNKDGTFDLPGVLPGAYNLQLWERRGRDIIASAPIEVKGANVEGVVVAADQAFALLGTVRVDPETASTAGIDVMLEGPRNGGHSGSIEGKREFRIEHVTPGEYVCNVFMGDQTEYVASIRYGGQEVLGARFHISSAAPIEILIKQGTGQVEGTVGGADPQEQAGSEANSSAKPASASTVVLISERVRFDRQGVLFAPTDQNGHFVFKGVPPGKYYVLASEDVDQGLWENRDFLAQIQPKALEVDLPENGKLEIRAPSISDDEVQRAMAALGQ